MKRLLIAALLAVGVLAATHGQAHANGRGFGFGMGFGFNFAFQPYRNNACANDGCYSAPGWSPYYSAPAMYGYPYNYGGYSPYTFSGYPLATSDQGASITSQAPSGSSGHAHPLPKGK